MAAPIGKRAFCKMFGFKKINMRILRQSFKKSSFSEIRALRMTFLLSTKTQSDCQILKSQKHSVTSGTAICDVRGITFARAFHSGAKHVVLGIETSCDDTGAAVVDSDGNVLGECLHSQTAVHVQ